MFTLVAFILSTTSKIQTFMHIVNIKLLRKCLLFSCEPLKTYEYITWIAQEKKPWSALYVMLSRGQDLSGRCRWEICGSKWRGAGSGSLALPVQWGPSLACLLDSLDRLGSLLSIPLGVHRKGPEARSVDGHPLAAPYKGKGFLGMVFTTVQG